MYVLMYIYMNVQYIENSLNKRHTYVRVLSLSQSQKRCGSMKPDPGVLLETIICTHFGLSAHSQQRVPHVFPKNGPQRTKQMAYEQ